MRENTELKADADNGRHVRALPGGTVEGDDRKNMLHLCSNIEGVLCTLSAKLSFLGEVMTGSDGCIEMHELAGLSSLLLGFRDELVEVSLTDVEALHEMATARPVEGGESPIMLSRLIPLLAAIQAMHGDLAAITGENELSKLLQRHISKNRGPAAVQ